MAFAAVVAAAGLSARMRDFKPMLCLGGTTIIRHTVDGLKAAGVEQIVVVTGYQSTVLERHLNSVPGVMLLKNERYAWTDMLSSIQLGLSALPSGVERVFLTPADVPLVSRETMVQMLKTPAQVVCPLYQGRRGHPILIRADAVGQVLAWQGEGGLRGLLDAGILETACVEAGDPAVLMDADTPQDYRRLLEYQARLRGHGDLRLDLQVNIGMEDLFLTTENVQLLDMIGQTGSIQNACACMHISYSKGWKAINTMERQLGFPVVKRTAGGTEGGGSSLTPRGAELLGCYRAFHRELDERARQLFDQHFPDYLRSPEKREGTT